MTPLLEVLRPMSPTTRLSLVMSKPAKQMVNIHEAKTHLSRLIESVCEGHGDVVISKAGKPMVKLVRFEDAPPQRTPGFLKGKIKIASDFDAPLPPDVLDAFEGKK